ncbi:MAG: hypothetical protein MZU91_12050 [Desulfosudis oleivorans]|nr:hypothetical protein [Desulfosudis oleivorans]
MLRLNRRLQAESTAPDAVAAGCEEAAVVGRARRRPARGGRPAGAHRGLDGRRRNLATVPGAGEFGPHRRVLWQSAKRGWSRRSPRRRRARVHRRRRNLESRQLDGRAVNELVLADVGAKLAAAPESEALQALVAEAEQVQRSRDGTKPFSWNVWFEGRDDRFRRSAHTDCCSGRPDGGATWQIMVRSGRQPTARGPVFDPSRRGRDALHRGRRRDRAPARPEHPALARPSRRDHAGSLFGVADLGEAVAGPRPARQCVPAASTAGRAGLEVDASACPRLSWAARPPGTAPVVAGGPDGWAARARHRHGGVSFEAGAWPACRPRERPGRRCGRRAPRGHRTSPVRWSSHRTAPR